MVKTRKNQTLTFKDLTYAEQAKSINGQIRELEASIKANLKKAIKDGKENPKEKRIKNLEDLIERIKLI